MFKKYLHIYSFGLFLLLTLVLGGPYSAEAAKISLGTSLSREEQIAQILEEVARLQRLLDARRAATVTAADESTKQGPYTIYETYYYGKSFEAIYEVGDNLELIRRDKSSAVRPSHFALWDYFVSVIGESEVKKYIDEFRVFNKSSSDIGAFVELRTRNKDQFWIVGINEDDFEPGEEDTEEIYSSLFVHEYAHILTFGDYPELIEDFDERFWTAADKKHSRKVEDFDGNEFDNALEDYYRKNKDRFVSDYATTNVDEDFAETFTQFVLDSRPSAVRTVRDQKIDFMYQSLVLKTARERLRENLSLD